MRSPDRVETFAVIDGNEAAARVAYALSELIAIYPITPASPMAEFADGWAAEMRPNLWGAVPRIVQLQSEAGAAGTLHGAATSGALSTTFTASQGLLLMIPNMLKIAGELTALVIHVAARTVATHALSIFGDHSDVMAARSTGFAMLASCSVQEAHDLALIAHAATLRSRVPFLHFFDGFRTSHEINKVALLSEGDMRGLIDEGYVRDHRLRGLTPDRPVLRGSAQNPDVFFQAREASNPFYLAVPTITNELMDQFHEVTGRRYGLFEYVGAPDAERVLVLMGSGVGAATEAVEEMNRGGARVGLVKVRLFRPFSAQNFVSVLPGSTREVVVLDRTKEPGAIGEPLYLDVLAALTEAWDGENGPPAVSGGRYGLSSKEFTPAMAAAALGHPRQTAKRHFTLGIDDDVTGTSLSFDATFKPSRRPRMVAVFYGLGSDGSVSAAKATAKILGTQDGRFAQAYSVYDSKKSGQVTVSHLRYDDRPIGSTYLVGKGEADFVACHRFGLLNRAAVLSHAKAGGTLLLNCPYGPEEVWKHIPVEVQGQISERHLRLFVVDADRIAAAHLLGRRINTILQTCFFALTAILPIEEAARTLQDSVKKSYGRSGDDVVARNVAAIRAAVKELHEVDVPQNGSQPAQIHGLADHVRSMPMGTAIATMIAGEGDRLPVSAFSPDGTFPTGTSQWEKRELADRIPIWDPAICIDCAKCVLVCPHSALRMKLIDPADLDSAPQGFRHKPWKGKDFPGREMTIQVFPDDCTGCELCVEVCPVTTEASEHPTRAINMGPVGPHRDRERLNLGFFNELPPIPRTQLSIQTIKGSQLIDPLFEFPGACAGCGETPYLKLISQLFGARMVVANATGCSSIYGGNLPTTPWSTDAAGRGPAWSNSLFEDNAEFGLGIRLALDTRSERARSLLRSVAHRVGENLAEEILGADQADEASYDEQRRRVEKLKDRLQTMDEPMAQELLALADDLVKKSVWIVGGDGWAYDIGFGGVDHVLLSGNNVNLLVLDTQVYSNTGGQASKATPRGARAKFAVGGKPNAGKDLGLIAMSYGGVYVAQVALGADNSQTIRALAEAESFAGPSLVIAYSPCIEHGIDLINGPSRQRDAVRSGMWPLYRFDPSATDGPPLKLDSRKPSISVEDFALQEDRFASLLRTDRAKAEALVRKLQADVDVRWHRYESLAKNP